MRRVLVVSMATLFLLAGAGVARADHTHVLIRLYATKRGERPRSLAVW
jgi:hypothetical protein